MNKLQTVYVGGDHRSVETTERVIAHLERKGFEVIDFSTHDSEEKLALEKLIPKVVQNVRTNANNTGILICGTGVGVEIGANRFVGIRASLCRDKKQSEFARTYDDANILCLGSWYNDGIEEILDSWFSNVFDGNKRRVEMLQEFDNWS